MFVDDFYKVSKKSLENFLDNLQVKNLDMMDFSYWNKEIFKKNHVGENTVTKTINKKFLNYVTKKIS